MKSCFVIAVVLVGALLTSEAEAQCGLAGGCGSQVTYGRQIVHSPQFAYGPQIVHNPQVIYNTPVVRTQVSNSQMQVGSVFYDEQGRRCVITSIGASTPVNNSILPQQQPQQAKADTRPLAPSLDDVPKPLEAKKTVPTPAPAPQKKPSAPSEF